MSESISVLRAAGLRVTKTRIALLKALQGQKPQNVQTLLHTLTQNRTKVHKTTVYRDVDTFAKAQLISAVQFGDGMIRYELAEQPHHHHLVCNACGRVEDVRLAHGLEKLERQLGRKFHFAKVNHNLEFHGQCKSCVPQSSNPG